jgi:hypothetical protein
MQGNRVPRWLVESDPSWEKSIDSNLGVLKWTKKGTNIEAVCPPTSMFCEIQGENENGSAAAAAGAAVNKNMQTGLADLNVGVERMGRQANPASGIEKYLSSRYLNPGINGPARFDMTKRLRRFS